MAGTVDHLLLAAPLLLVAAGTLLLQQVHGGIQVDAEDIYKTIKVCMYVRNDIYTYAHIA